jgi:hypothetical protein
MIELRNRDTSLVGRVLIYAQIGVRFRGQTGKHLLRLCLSAFGPVSDISRHSQHLLLPWCYGLAVMMTGVDP